MNNQKPYTLFKRGKVWYAHFRALNGERVTAKSTGQTAKARAEQWCIDYLQQGQGRIVKSELITFQQFARGFFDWSGAWATDKRVKGLRISHRHCQERTNILNNHIIPAFGKMRLTAIDKESIDSFRNTKFAEGFSGGTVNKLLSALKTILEAAEDHKLIRFVPRIDRAGENPKEKDILSIDDVKKLFAVEWPDLRGYVGNMLAASTGLRLGELQALTLSDLHLDENYITIRQSWDRSRQTFTGTTKTGRERNIFIPANIKKEIIKLINSTPYNKTEHSFLFYAEKSEHKPAEPKIFSRSLYRALAEIGITEEERAARNITFHSWRHFLNSLLINAKIPIHKIQSITGHLTAEMTERYYKLDNMADVVKITTDLLN